MILKIYSPMGRKWENFFGDFGSKCSRIVEINVHSNALII
jgi:hypothetical protein